MAMSTPACGQQPVGSEASPLLPMSCGTAHAQSERSRSGRVFKANSPMCISPDTWATPQQLQWEASPETAPAVTAQMPAAVSPTHSQMQAANLEFGFDAIQHALTGSHAKSRLASTSLADDFSASSSSTGEDKCLHGLHGSGEWMEDLELSPSQSTFADSEDVDEQQHDPFREPGDSGQDLFQKCSKDNPPPAQALLANQVSNVPTSSRCTALLSGKPFNDLQIRNG